MTQIIEIEGEILENFLDFMTKHLNAGTTYRLRIAVDGEVLKAKANEFMWTPSMGPVSVVQSA
jgi:hypothetical protein